jgi:hypothetical protein
MIRPTMTVAIKAHNAIPTNGSTTKRARHTRNIVRITTRGYRRAR